MQTAKKIKKQFASSKQDALHIQESSFTSNANSPSKKEFNREWNNHILHCDEEIKEQDHLTGIYFRSCSIDTSQCPNHQCIQKL